jgi:predicted transcriptional regulator
MVHKGEIIKKAVNQSGVSVTQVAKSMGVTRKTIYNIFERIDVDNDTILKIGTIIHYDFSEKFPKLKKPTKTEDPQEEYYKRTMEQLKADVDLWKGKYIALLEDYNKLLKK